MTSITATANLEPVLSNTDEAKLYRTNLFTNWRIFTPVEDRLETKVEENPVYPFQEVSPNVLEYSITYPYLFVSLGIFLVSLAVFVAMQIQGYDQIWYPASIITGLVSLIAANNFKHLRHYTLNQAQQEYTFSHSLPWMKQSRKVYHRGTLHNIYIRLCKERIDGRSHFYLVLNGYRMDSTRISGSSRALSDMRRLGQQIARNLNLNYFDITNSSEYHIIRHDRPIKKKKHMAKAGSQADRL